MRTGLKTRKNGKKSMTSTMYSDLTFLSIQSLRFHCHYIGETSDIMNETVQEISESLQSKNLTELTLYKLKKSQERLLTITIHYSIDEFTSGELRRMVTFTMDVLDIMTQTRHFQTEKMQSRTT